MIIIIITKFDINYKDILKVYSTDNLIQKQLM